MLRNQVDVMLGPALATVTRNEARRSCRRTVPTVCRRDISRSYAVTGAANRTGWITIRSLLSVCWA